MEEELKVYQKFSLNPDYTAILDKFTCFYNSGKVPVVGTLYIMNTCVCFSSKLNVQALFGNQTKVKFLMTEIIYADLESTIGKQLKIYLADGQVATFTRFREGLKNGHIIILNMVENA